MSFNQDERIGILGGGQLGKMICQIANDWDLDIWILDKSPDMPAAHLCKQFIKGDFTAYADVMAFGNEVDIITIEIEKVNVRALKDLKAKGKKVFPDPTVLETIQDKGLQKNFYDDNDLPTASYALYEDNISIEKDISEGKLNLPFVQKLRTEGYDGRGVQYIKSDDDLENLFEAPSVVEYAVEIEKELSVIVIRNDAGETITYPPVEMVFDHEANLVDYLHCPADIDNKTSEKLEELSNRVMDTYDLSGILAIEYFLDVDENILINEVAPRPHNSGHHTIESTNCSQFEHHLRAIMNLPLREIEILNPSIMVNLLGEVGHRGRVKYKGMETILKQPFTFVHLYGKSITRPFRKMGHVTRFINSSEEPAAISKSIKSDLKIITE